MKPSIDWTPERIEQLRQLREDEGLSYQQIADRMGVTKNTVIGKAQRLGWGVPKLEPPRSSCELPPVSRCHYPHGDPRADGFHFCGKPVIATGKPYCAEHQARCVQVMPARMLEKSLMGD